LVNNPNKSIFAKSDFDNTENGRFELGNKSIFFNKSIFAKCDFENMVADG
jgi:hypothetical protein